MSEEIKADVTLHTGKEITFDFHQIKFKEWRGLFDKDEPEETSNAKIAKVCGLTPAEFDDLTFADHFLLMQEFWKRSRDPLTDPKNSPSVPT